MCLMFSRAMFRRLVLACLTIFLETLWTSHCVLFVWIRPYLRAIRRLIRLSFRLNLAIVRREADLITVTFDRSLTMILPNESAAVMLLRFLSMPSIPSQFTFDVSFEKEIQTLETVRDAERNLIPGCLSTLKV